MIVSFAKPFEDEEGSPYSYVFNISPAFYVVFSTRIILNLRKVITTLDGWDLATTQASTVLTNVHYRPAISSSDGAFDAYELQSRSDPSSRERGAGGSRV
jgi:hypothetical protein